MSPTTAPLDSAGAAPSASAATAATLPSAPSVGSETLVVSAVGLVVVMVAFLVLGRRLGWFEFDLFGVFRAKGGRSPTGVTIKNVESKHGGITATDESAQGATIEDATAEKDIQATVKGPSDQKKT